MKFGHLMNRASLVAVHEAGLVNDDTAKGIASALVQIEAEFEGRYTSIVVFIRDYLTLEKRLVELVGPNASLLHLGRSRQDMISTCVHASARECMRDTLAGLVDLRATTQKVAARNFDTIIPAYTHGVQAQPTSYAHYLLAFDESFGRSASRLTEGYSRVNRCPLGAGALTTSSFKLDRDLLATLLGFDGASINSLGANQIAPVDALLETSFALSILATQIGQLAQDIHQTYSNSRSWFHLDPGELTSISTMMPQKRNPRVLELLRELSGRIIGKAQSLTLIAHNLQSGMTEIRWSMDLLPLDEIRQMLLFAGKLVSNLHVDSKKALEEIEREYSTITELVDTLYRKARVPFRIGHHFASELCDYGRLNGLSPTEIKYEDAAKLYKELNCDAEFPIEENDLKEALDPTAFVAARAGLGGPQRVEVERMLVEHQASLHGNIEALQDIDRRREVAATELDRRIGLLIRE